MSRQRWVYEPDDAALEPHLGPDAPPMLIGGQALRYIGQLWHRRPMGEQPDLDFVRWLMASAQPFNRDWGLRSPPGATWALAQQAVAGLVGSPGWGETVQRAVQEAGKGLTGAQKRAAFAATWGSRRGLTGFGVGTVYADGLVVLDAPPVDAAWHEQERNAAWDAAELQDEDGDGEAYDRAHEAHRAAVEALVETERRLAEARHVLARLRWQVDAHTAGRWGQVNAAVQDYLGVHECRCPDHAQRRAALLALPEDATMEHVDRIIYGAWTCPRHGAVDVVDGGPPEDGPDPRCAECGEPVALGPALA